MSLTATSEFITSTVVLLKTVTLETQILCCQLRAEGTVLVFIRDYFITAMFTEAINFGELGVWMEISAEPVVLFPMD